MTKPSRNWYSVSRNSRMSGQTRPIPRSSTGGSVPTRTLPTPAARAKSSMAWPWMSGSFELYGQLHNAVGETPRDRSTFFAECVRHWIHFTGIA
jgi:hypothetical protein